MEVNMTNPIRNSFILNHAFRKYFVASVLVSIIAQLNTLVDGIIVSQTVGTDALSTVSMSIPILALVMLVATMICAGASLVMAGEIGSQNYKQVDRLFTMSLSSVFVINLILAIVLCSCTNVISYLLTSEERLFKIFKVIGAGRIVFSVIAIAFPTLLARLFGADGELLQMAEEPLRVFSFIFIPFGMIIPLSYLFMILERTVMSTILTIGIAVEYARS